MTRDNENLANDNNINIASKGKSKTVILKILVYILLIFLALICIFPFYMLIINSTRASSDIQKGFSLFPGTFLIKNFEGVREKENTIPIIRGLGNSLFISCCVAILTTYFSALTAYGLHIYNFKFKKAVFAFIMLIMMVPAQVSTLGFLKIIGNVGLMDSYIPLIIPSIASPIVFFFMKQYMESVLPYEMVEAARVDGAGEFRIFNQISLPILKPAIALQAIFGFVSSWNNYFVPNLVLETTSKKTVPILIALLRSADYLTFDLGVVYLTIFIAIIPLLIIYLLLSKHIVGGISLGSVKG